MVRSSKELLGKVLGSCTLEQLLGQGGMGARAGASCLSPSPHDSLGL